LNISCPFNYTGGKFKLLEQLQPLFDKKEVFLDLFAGGGNVGINSSSSKVIFNDLNEKLIDLIKFIKDTDTNILLKQIDSIIDDHGYMADGFLNEYSNRVSKKGLQILAKLKSMWPSVGKFYFASLKEAIPRHAKEVTDKMISSEEKSIKANQVKLTEAKQDIDKMEKIIKDLESKKNTLSVYLKFGESFTAHYKCQNLIEVGVKTDKGSWTFNFNR